MIKTVWTFLALMHQQKKEIICSICLSFIDGLFVMVPFVIVFNIINRIPLCNPQTAEKSNLTTMYWYIGIMTAAVLIRIVLRYFTLYFRGGAGYIALCQERKNTGYKLRTVSLGYLNEKNTGDLVATITSDAAFLEIEGMSVVEKLATGLPVFIIGLVILLSFDYRIFLLTVILFIPVWFVYKNLSLLQDRLKINRQELIGAFTQDIVEFINGLHVLKIYNMAEKQFSKTKAAVKKLRDFSVNVELAHIPAVALFQVCFRLITTAIVFSSALIFLQQKLSFAQVFLLMTASFSLFNGIEAMGIFSIFSKMTQQSIDRMNAIKDVPEMQDLSGTELLTSTKPDALTIHFNHVHFAYNEKEVLHDISFSIPEKTTTALVGLSGSGKTTIINLLARFWDIHTGSITIGGTDIKKIKYENLLHNISFVFQDVFLFNDTILNNIKLGNEKAPLESVYAAAERAGCSDFIQRLENGYDTIIDEAGMRLSGGEKQRISIARALLKDAPIVLLDEVTAHVDSVNEEKIRGALQELLRDKTVIMIAHKLTNVQHADQILVLEEGHIIQRGTHQQLVNQEGRYKTLWEMGT